jgi:hypothetical protein
VVLVEVEQAYIGYGSGYTVRASESGMTVTQLAEPQASVTIDPDTFGELVALARFLGWEGAE